MERACLLFPQTTTGTVSRLEPGRRRPSLELLLPLAQTYRIPLDDLVGAPAVGDPRIRLKPRRVNGRVVVPLTRNPGQPGEVAEFDTRLPRWFGGTGEEPAEVLSLNG